MSKCRSTLRWFRTWRLLHREKNPRVALFGAKSIALRELPDDAVLVDRVLRAAARAHHHPLALEPSHRSAMPLSAFGTYEGELLPGYRHRTPHSPAATSR